MATKSDQAAALHSSIALLQERFKQLQKTREMRQERELLRLLAETRERRTTTTSSSSSSYSPSSMHYQSSATAFYNSEMICQQRPSSQPPLSIWPDSQMKHANFVRIDETAAQDHTKSWQCDTSTIGNTWPVMNKFDDSSSDVDTSLHL